jgi:hypothetical protein
MIQKVRVFQRAVEPSFPDNDALPKKSADEEKFDKTFNEWYDDMKINLDRLQDQLTTFYQTDINESIDTQKQQTGDVLSSLNKNLVTTIQDLNDTILSAQQTLQAVENNLYSK